MTTPDDLGVRHLALHPQQICALTQNHLHSCNPQLHLDDLPNWNTSRWHNKDLR